LEYSFPRLYRHAHGWGDLFNTWKGIRVLRTVVPFKNPSFKKKHNHKFTDHSSRFLNIYLITGYDQFFAGEG